METTMTTLLCVGHSALDTIYRLPAIPKTPTKVLATACVEAGGGMAANASVAASRLGAHVSYCGRVGDDAAGATIVAQLAAEGVDVTMIRRIAHCQSPKATVLIDDDGERLVCIYNDPALDPSSSWLPAESIRKFDVVLTDVRWPEGAARVLDVARGAGIPTIFDGDVGPQDALRDLCARSDYAIFSAPGLALSSGTADPGEGLRRMQAAARGVVGVTLGADGLLWREGGRELRSLAPPVNVIDTLAAGDVFHGAFALAIGEGRTVLDSARFANAAAALKCTRFGGRLGAPTRMEVEAFLRVS
jgi:sulfofructose kinase